MDYENYFNFPEESEEVNRLIKNFHYFMIFSNMKNKSDVEKFFEFAKKFEEEINNSKENRSPEFNEKIFEIEKILQKFNEHKEEMLPESLKITNTFSTYCSKFKIYFKEPYPNDREFEDAILELKFGGNIIPEL